VAADPIVAPPRPRAPQRPRLRPAPPPRRVSGPARTTTGRPRTTRAAVALPAPTPLHRVLDLLRGLPDARWLDRLLRGQGWIVLIGVALMGIVAMQVSLLKLNAGIGTSIERSGALERQNADLRAEVSRLSSEARIASVAGKIGLVMPDAGEVRYVGVRGERDALKAAAIMRAPDPVEDLGTTATSDPAAATTATATAPAASTTTTDPASGTTATAPPAPTTPTAQTAPATSTPTQSTPSGTSAGATAAPAGTTAAAGQ
jgi:cell division protein FtsL